MLRIIALLLLVLFFSNAAQAQTTCQNVRAKPVDLRVTLTMPPDAEYNFTKSREFLSGNKEKIAEQWAKDTEKKLWMEQGYISGFAHGGLGWTAKMEYSWRQFGGPASNAFCTFFDMIDIELYYGTVIFVANEYQPGTCRYDVVMNHELRHHQINQAIAAELSERLKRDLPGMVAQIESHGYVTQDRLTPRFKTMEESLYDAVGIYMDSMTVRMGIENGKIDTLENYKRESALCPDPL